ncbi:MAG: 30S ribosomal protein S18 [Bdellovibrionales bacterium]|nr:30S ribosomal protein S18 [Bdellovibrionales bacterium]
MKRKLFVSNLDFDVTEEQLKEVFDTVGDTVSVVLATDRETKRSKGFAFVEMGSDELAEKAISELNDKEVNGRPIRVTEDRGKGGGSAPSASRGGPEGERKPREHLPPIQRMQLFRRRKKLDPFLQDPKKTIDYRDIAMLSKFVSDRGKILSRRMTGLTAYNQRKVAKAIKRAQSLGLMPYSA